MIVPAMIYAAFNWHDPATLRGWAIPAATDIAFALGVLAIIGSRVPTSLKVFLTALAILDDLGAIVIIGVFYTAHVSGVALGLAAAGVALLFAFNRLGDPPSCSLPDRRLVRVGRGVGFWRTCHAGRGCGRSHDSDARSRCHGGG